MLAKGEGRTLGEALIAAYRDAVPTMRLRRGWHAQLTALTASGPGWGFLGASGLSVTAETLTRWLSESQNPSGANQRRIDAAYRQYYYSRPNRAEATVRFRTLDGSITGLVQTETSGPPRYRGRPPNAPLLIDHAEGEWGYLMTLLQSAEPDPDEVTDRYIGDVILNDLSFSVLSFPGNHYEIEVI